MTTFKQFTLEDTFPSWSYSQLKACIFIFSIFSSVSIYSQYNTEIIHQQHKITYKKIDAEKAMNTEPFDLNSVPVLTETNINATDSETGDTAFRLEDNFAIDQEKSDGIDMYMSGAAFRGSSKITCIIEFARDGHTVVKVLDAFSGEILATVIESATKAGRETFEIDQNDFEVKNIIIVATHTGMTGQKITSSLHFELSRTEDEPLHVTDFHSLNFDAQLTPTLGRGLFKIQADFKSAVPVKVLVHDLNGRLVETLFTGKVNAGMINFNGDSSQWTAGTYIISIQAGRDTWSHKMIVQ